MAYSPPSVEYIPRSHPLPNRRKVSFHPIQRSGAEYEQKLVNQWLSNYHTLLNFFFDAFLKNSGQTPQIAKSAIIHYHTLRNKLYHEGKNFVPTERDLQDARGAAIYIFSTLFHVDGEKLLNTLPPMHTWTTKKFHFNGKGNGIYKIPLEVGSTIFRIQYKGKGYVRISLYDENDRHMKRIVEPLGTIEDEENESIFTYQNSKPVNIRKAGIYLLKIQTLGVWEIEVEQ